MITDSKNKKQLIVFLINRWEIMANSAAIERVYLASYKYCLKNNLPIPIMPIQAMVNPCRSIEIIKYAIMKIMPETHFIDYTFEAQAPLNADDFMEIYIKDHEICISKVKELVKKMEIT